MSYDAERPLREQLIEARASILIQLGELEAPHYRLGVPDNRELIATLEAELGEIDELLGTSEDDVATGG